MAKVTLKNIIQNFMLPLKFHYNRFCNQDAIGMNGRITINKEE
jgi:hypothetical protein